MSNRYLDFAQKTVESSVEPLKENAHGSLEVRYKSKFDLFTKMDEQVENSIVGSIRENFPEHDIVTEETDLERVGSDKVWYIDPISGSTNYAHGLPIYGISLALKVDDEIKVGAVYNSVTDKVFYAEKDEGAYLEGEKISVSTVDELEKSVVSTTFPYNEEDRKKNLEYFNKIAPQVEGIRRTGSVSVDLSFLALGAIEGFWAIELKSWDTAAGWLLVEESGGEVSRINGEKYDLKADSVLVSNGEIHSDLMELMTGS